MKTTKHAYLIIAHQNDLTLKTLIHVLDDIRNDIYIHVDKKAKKFNCNTIKCLHANLYFTKSTKVSWGGYSLINAELILLEEATKQKYSYYHLLSGLDLPIKSQDYIHNFFRKNKGYEFIEVGDTKFYDRVQYIYPFQNLFNCRNKSIGFYLNVISIQIQKFLHIKRNKNLHLKVSSQWFSITHSLATYILDNRKWISKTFKYGFACDELFIPTLISQSKKFRKRLYSPNLSLRYIDWERGNPYVLRSSDYKNLIKSQCLFARKFDEKIDSKIIQKMNDYIVKK